jgi:hypothetical protein
MPYIEEGWTDEQKALVMADEALKIVVDEYNKLVEQMKDYPEASVLLRFRFPAAHAAAVRSGYVRPAIPNSIWTKVDADAKEKENVAEDFFKK